MFDPVTEFNEACKFVESQLKSRTMTEEEILALRSSNYYIYKNCNPRD